MTIVQQDEKNIGNSGWDLEEENDREKSMKKLSFR